MTKKELNENLQLINSDIDGMVNIAQSIIDLYVKDENDKIMASPRLRMIYEIGKSVKQRAKTIASQTL